ncbi:MAG TPA: hypothetical protein VM451_00300 [Candidatus Limnocylindria bacterium]|nr:hypothetical protein [Candidatus Limnocylindria bacterium]
MNDQETKPEGAQDDADDTEGQKFNIGLGPVTPDDADDTEGQKFNIGLGPVTPEEGEDTEGQKFNIGLGPVTPDDKGADGISNITAPEGGEPNPRQ